MKIPANPWRYLVIACAILLASGMTTPRGGIGGTGRPQGGISGTGVTAIGVIQKFGSIYVNGTEYLLLPSTRYRIDGQHAKDGALRRGNVVFVEARVQSGQSTAETVRVQHALVGVIKTVSQNGHALGVLGQTVIVGHATIRGGGNSDLRWRPGMDVRVSALANGPGLWQATRIERLKVQRSANLPFLIRGPLKALHRHTLTLGQHLFPSTAPTTPPLGSYVVAQGYYRSGHAIITKVRRAAGLAQARSRLVFIAGYLRATHTGWRYEGTALQKPSGAALVPSPGPSFFVAARTTDGTFIIRRITPAIDVMTYGLAHIPRGPDTDRAVLDRSRARIPRSLRPHIERPFVSRPALTHPDLDLSRPPMP